MSFLFRLLLSVQLLLLSSTVGLYANAGADIRAHEAVGNAASFGHVQVLVSGHSQARPFLSIVRKEKAVLDNDENTDESNSPRKQIKADNYFYTLFSAKDTQHNFFHTRDYIQKSRYIFYSCCPTYIMLRVIRL